jgi:hypothetical protein
VLVSSADSILVAVRFSADDDDEDNDDGIRENDDFSPEMAAKATKIGEIWFIKEFHFPSSETGKLSAFTNAFEQDFTSVTEDEVNKPATQDRISSTAAAVTDFILSSSSSAAAETVADPKEALLPIPLLLLP